MKKQLHFFLLTFISVLFFSGTIDLDNLFNYENQTVPSYITKDNTPLSNLITDEGATLGRVLFYDNPHSLSNGFVDGNANFGILTDYTVTRSPTLRDILDAEGNVHGPLFHSGFTNNLRDSTNLSGARQE